MIGGKAIIDAIESYNARKQVLEAEKKAFSSLPGTLVTQTKELWESQEPSELHAKLISDTFEASQDALRIGSLFDLYSKHIEKYQTETQARAGWLFIFTIVAMMAGLAFVVWGGTHVLRYNGWQHIAAGCAIAAIGGAISAYITKTFLDVHRLSLRQVNHYFRQPVLNAHILTAQRLADQLGDPAARRKCYEAVIAQISRLIVEAPFSQSVDEPAATERLSSSARKPSKARRTRAKARSESMNDA